MRRFATLLAFGLLWLGALAQTPIAAWQFFGNAAPNNPATPGLGKKTIYYPCLTRLYAVNVEDGTLKWQYPADAPLDATILGQPVEGENLVYFGASNGNVYALDIETGAVRWIFRARSAPTARFVLDEDILYIGTGGGEVYAINARNGEPVWSAPYRTEDYITGSLVKVEDTLYFGTNGGFIHAITASGGRRRWVYRLPAPNYDPQPVYANNSIYAASSDQLLALNPNSGALRWRRQFTTELRLAPAANEDYVVVTTRENRVLVYDHNGRLIAGGDKAPITLRYEPLFPPVIHEGDLWVVTRRGTLLRYSLPEGQLKWLYTVRPPEGTLDANNRRIAYLAITSRLLFIPNGLVVATAEGNLTAFLYNWVDRTPPQVVRTLPGIGEMMSGQLPLDFFARIRDDGSGVDPGSVQFLLDDEPLEAEYDPSLGEVTVRLRSGGTVQPLADGRHTLTVVASDWAGNTMRYTWAIHVDNSLRRTPTRPRQQQQPTGPGTGGRGGRGGGDF